MYNQYQSTQYGRPHMPPGYGGFGGPPGVPLGMGPPPGTASSPPGMSPAPGVGPAPGMLQTESQQPGRLGGVPMSFHPPANMPNINFSAPVIRLGTTGPSKPLTTLSGDTSGRKGGIIDGQDRHRSGLGASQGIEQQRQALKDSMMTLVPPTKEEVVRTIFVGAITEGAGGDDGIERILRTAGNLKRWNRATDADGKQCTFGFAEYEDPESLGMAIEVLKDVEVPVMKQHPKASGSEGMVSPVTSVEKSRLLIIHDENSLDYLEQYRSSRGGEDPSTAQSRLDSARASLDDVLAELSSPSLSTDQDTDGDVPMQDTANKTDGSQAEIVTIPLTVEDELADIPAEMRETVAQEIAAFRDRSNRRDMERLKREEEIEHAEKVRNGYSRGPRMASPPPIAPSGPASGAIGIPLGPRIPIVQGAPLGPKGFQGQQMPRDYQKGVAFVNGSGVNGAGHAGWLNREDEESDASDEELEQRRFQKKEAELEKQYLDHERRWINREKSRTAAVEREKLRDKEDSARQAAEKEAMAKRLRDWNDDIEARRKVEEYYQDRSLWNRNRASFRRREIDLDERDRLAEERENTREQAQREQARGAADQFLAQQAEEMAIAPSMREPQRFKLSLGAAAQKAQAAVPKRTVAEVEGLLEDEEEASASTKRTLIPIKFDSAAEIRGLPEEEREQAVRQLAAEIPTEKDGLWAWPVKWEFVDDAVVSEKLKPFVERKIVEYLGVQEQMLVEVVEEHIRKRGGPQELVEMLEGALDEEAEVLVKKLWRMVIFFSESEKGGLSA